MTQASPTVINDITDLYRILDEQPQWKEALRNQILGAELLAVPQRLAQLTEQIHELREIVGQLAQTTAEHSGQLTELTAQMRELRIIVEEHTRQLTELTAQLKELRAITEEHTHQLVELRQTTEEHTRQLTELTTQVKELRAIAEENTRQLVELRQIAESQARQLEDHTWHLADMRRISENHTARMDRMESDFGEIKGMLAESRLDRTSLLIAANLDLYRPVLVPNSELEEYAQQLGLERSTRISFINADLVFTAQFRDATVGCAVEISWTIDQRDLDRARRNAELFQQATGARTYAVVTGQRYEDNLDWREVQWVQLRDR